MDWSPAGDGASNVLVHSNHDGEHHQHDHRVPGTQAIREVVIVFTSSLWGQRDDGHNLIHGVKLVEVRRAVSVKVSVVFLSLRVSSEMCVRNHSEIAKSGFFSLRLNVTPVGDMVGGNW